MPRRVGASASTQSRDVGDVGAPVAEPAPRAAGSRGILINLVLATAAILAAIACVDLVAFFLLGLKPPGYGVEDFFQYSFLTGFAHTPSVRGTWYRYEDGTRFEVRTNGFGFPDDERSLEKTRPRIALIGDSTTQFWEADPDDRPQARLAALLGGRFEVLNFGVRSFGTDQTLLTFEHVGSQFSPDIVVYTFCVNDVHDNQNEGKPHFVLDDTADGGVRLLGYPAAMRPGSHSRYDDWLRVAKHSFLFRRTYELARLWFRPPTPLADHFELRPYKAAYDDADTKGFDLTLALIDAMNEAVRRRGMRFLLVEGIFRDAYDERARAQMRAIYGDVFDFDKVSRLLATNAEAHGIPFLSLPRAWRAEAIPIARIMHPEDNLHLNGEGARLYARSLRDELDALGWLSNPGTGPAR
jgi:lysophospholipase L1-like esterase